MQTTIQRAHFPAGRRVLMLSDIHGHIRELDDVLSRARFCSDDILVIVGDFVEKGPESLAVLRRIMALCRTHTVYPLMGNVDLGRLIHLLSEEEEKRQRLLRYSFRAEGWWGGSLLHDLCRELGVSMTEGMDTRAVFSRIRDHFAPEIAFLQGLPTALETDRMIFVHGGLPHERLAELAGGDPAGLLKCDAFLAQGLSFQKQVVVGHWPTTLYRTDHPDYAPIWDRERHIICLDGGCGVKTEGQLNLLIWPEENAEEYALLSSDSLPEATAFSDQAASADSAYIKWTDHSVTVLSRGEDWARVLFHGREMRVPDAYLMEEEGQMICNDMTDYCLPVQKGEKLKVVLRIGNACYAKKGSIVGWYGGGLSENEAKRAAAREEN